MRYEHVCIESLAHELPPHVVTSDDIEQQLAPVYERLGLPFGRLELMTGIRERRFFARGIKPGCSFTVPSAAINWSQRRPAECIMRSGCRSPLRFWMSAMRVSDCSTECSCWQT